MKKNTLILLLTLAVAACGGGSDADEMPETDVAEDSPAGTVMIAYPTDGSVVDGPTITVELESTVPIVPAGEMTQGTGHHHLYLDADVTEADVPIPTVEGSIVHMGDASSSFTFEGVSAGPHRLIAVVADGAHIPLQPWVVDTVEFTVREQP